MERETYASKDVQKATGLTRQKVDYIVGRGGIIPHSDSDGTGNYREFSFANLVEFGLAKVLTSQIKISSMKRINFLIEKTRKRAPEYFESPFTKGIKTITPKVMIVRLDGANQQSEVLNVRTLDEAATLMVSLHGNATVFVTIYLDQIREAIIKNIGLA